MKRDNKIVGVGLLTAIGSSLCCITPVLALISGTSGVASNFSWLEPFRPYLIGFTVFVLGFAWYRKLKPKREIDCSCDTNRKSSFLQSKTFLAIITLFAIFMTIFPYYSSVFYSKLEKQIIIVDKENIQSVKFNIKGMTCASCKKHINQSVNQLNGLLKVKSSYKKVSTEIEFDNTKITIEDIEKTINSTGYSVINIKE